MFSQWRFGRALASALARVRAGFSLLWLVFAALLVFGVTGATKVTFDDALLRFFRSDFPAYEEFLDVARDFESDSNDVIVLIEADDLADPTVLMAVSDFLLDAQFVDGVRAAVSPLSLQVTGADGEAEPLVPFPLPDRATMAARFDAERGGNAALRRLMGPDRNAMVAILPISDLDSDVQDGRANQIDALADLADKAEAASGATIRLSGYPVLRDRVARGLVSDVLLLNLVGAAVGFIVAVIALRSVTLGLLTLAGPLVSLVTSLGVFGHLGITVNTVSVTLPVLVLILATSDSIHISFERARQAGRDSKRATVRAVRRVAIACIFAGITTAVAFAALTLSRAEIIAELGRMGTLLILLSSFTVLLTQTLILGAAGHHPWFNEKFERLERRPPSGLFFVYLPRLALARPRTVATLGLIVLVVATVFYSQASPRYSILDSLSPNEPVIAAFRDIEEKVTPVSVLQVAVRSTDTEVISEVHDTVVRVAGSDKVQSLARLSRDMGGADEIPEALARRLVSEDGSRALVTLSFQYESGEQTDALAARIDAAIAANPALDGVEVSAATGLPVMTARVAAKILTELNRSLLIALAAVGVLITLWLRSIRVALISLIPNVLPVSLIGAWLALSGHGIEFANGLALAVAFGVAVDDTLHVLNRLRLTGGFSRIGRTRLREALDEATPALVTTSTVLVLGMGGSIFATTKGVADFGTIAMSVYVLALIADLLVLPAVIAVFGPHKSPAPGRRN
ncbi:efflux RND transporter permease subunit [Maritimibacter fusiformis]|uniref:MMPL family transporter n=1 Tax=Maritimibacter fusiformis TaxID=2603819 RepID=A0A5D0RHN6_9RHOB|nr:MMPL family transporter [Maritimibacter fusiformis]TYB80559.1 MMPL family transporter [Maritimibacter fusiformis]